MSTLFPQIARVLRERSAKDDMLHLVSDGGLLDPREDDGGCLESPVIEGDGTFFVKPMAPGPFSGFTHFLDGVQLWRLVGYLECAPLIYGYTAAVVMARGEDRCLRPWGEPVAKEGLFLPLSLCDYRPFEDAGIPVFDTLEEMDHSERPTLMRCGQAAMESLSKMRDEAEKGLVRTWKSNVGDSGAGWLFIDGTLRHVDLHERIVGVAKSHRTEHFTGDDQARVLRLAEGERTSVFLPDKSSKGSWDEKVCSWYLRLQPCRGKDVTFGLIRIEAKNSEHIMEQADEISSWLLAERNPTSFPDFRWDRLFYPIHGCEMFLRSLMPTKILLESLSA